MTPPDGSPQPLPPDLEFAAALERAKLEALKDFAYGAGHEINNPLANIATRAQTLLKSESDPEKRRLLSAINAQAFRAHEMIADLMLFARPPRLERRPTSLAAVVQEVLAEFAAEAQERDIDLGQLAPPPASPLAIPTDASVATIDVDPVQCKVALAAIVRNALEAVGHRGQVLIDFSSTNDGAAEITVSDTGPGIPPELRSKIFNPYFSGREAGRGLGFGLCKAWRIVTDHRGTLEVQTDAQGRNCLWISLPSQTSASAAPTARFPPAG